MLTESVSDLFPSPDALPEESAPFDPEDGAMLIMAATPGPFRRCRASDGQCVCGLIWSQAIDKDVATVHRKTADGDFTAEQQEANAKLITWLLNNSTQLVEDSRRAKRLPWLLLCAIVGATIGRDLIGWLL